MSDGSRFVRYGCGVLLGFMLIACIAAMMYGLAGLKDLPDALEGSNAFLNRLGRGEVQPAYASTTPEYQAGTSLEKFREMVAKYPLLTKKATRKLGGLKMIKVAKEDRAIVESKLSEGKDTTTVSLTMKKVGDAWKVESFDVP